MNFIMLDIDEILELHDDVINNLGGIHGIKNESQLLSSLKRPFTLAFGYETFPTIEEKISVVAHSIIYFHVFNDGNKRTGMYVLFTLLDMNDICVDYEQYEITDLAVNIAEGKYDVPEIANWINEHKINR